MRFLIAFIGSAIILGVVWLALAMLTTPKPRKLKVYGIPLLHDIAPPPVLPEAVQCPAFADLADGYRTGRWTVHQGKSMGRDLPPISSADTLFEMMADGSYRWEGAFGSYTERQKNSTVSLSSLDCLYEKRSPWPGKPSNYSIVSNITVRFSRTFDISVGLKAGEGSWHEIFISHRNGNFVSCSQSRDACWFHIRRTPSR